MLLQVVSNPEGVEDKYRDVLDYSDINVNHVPWNELKVEDCVQANRERPRLVGKQSVSDVPKLRPTPNPKRMLRKEIPCEELETVKQSYSRDGEIHCFSKPERTRLAKIQIHTRDALDRGVHQIVWPPRPQPDDRGWSFSCVRCNRGTATETLQRFMRALCLGTPDGADTKTKRQSKSTRDGEGEEFNDEK